MERQPCVYMLASKRNGTLYTGVTSNLLKRVWEHKNNLVEGFTSKYGVHTRLWYTWIPRSDVSAYAGMTKLKIITH